MKQYKKLTYQVTKNTVGEGEQTMEWLEGGNKARGPAREQVGSRWAWGRRREWGGGVGPAAL